MEKLDIRVSIVPITEGEKVVMRLLSEKSRQFSLEDLGLETDDLAKVRRAIEKPYGMILAVGPTGCGKTTTLYAILKILNERDVNIMTIEDPVEYDVSGVNQIQVNPKTDLTFAKGLRSIVRQDPDIILVGEIRDDETAGIAINSAMTGHLVLSTLHTNDAATTFVRLMDMKIESFLVASTVNVVVAQRLLRKICTQCLASQEIQNPKFEILNKSQIQNPNDQKKKVIKEQSNTSLAGLPQELIAKYFGDRETIRIYHGKGCDVCHNTGYAGRVGIYEVLEVNEEIKKAINSSADSDTIAEIAKKSGMTTMLEDGLRKVQRGITTIEEVLRVTKE